jgi:hypothetical protein
VRIGHFGSVASEQENLKRLSRFLKAVSTTAARWRRLRNDPLFPLCVVLSVWALLFLLAIVIQVKAQTDPARSGGKASGRGAGRRALATEVVDVSGAVDAASRAPVVTQTSGRGKRRRAAERVARLK